jgi:atypical dual specificity phosphatase
VRGFYWLIPEVLAGSPRPGARERSLHDLETIEQDLAWLRDQGIGALLSLTEDPLPFGAVADAMEASLHLPIVDMTAPSPPQFSQALAFIDAQVAAGRAVAVHCLAGQGRTGSILAAYLIRAGRSPEEAIAELRTVCPHAVENPAQEEALTAFALRRDWIL